MIEPPTGRTGLRIPVPAEVAGAPGRRPAGAAPGRPLLFLDFEASSLSPWSWPIEIGYAWIAADAVASASALIAPRRGWSLADWSEAAAGVHGIARSELARGLAADAVAGLTDAFVAFDVVSDNADWEQRWLDRLREGRPPLPVRPLREAVGERLDEDAANAVASALLASRQRHRAGPDACRLARAWLAGARAAENACRAA